MRMKKLSKALLLALGGGSLIAAQSLAAAEDPRPNILLFLADDMGYSDIGAYGGEVQTPNLDELSKNALNFTNYYASASCTPTRAIIMSGVDNHRNGVGSMASNIRGTTTQKGQPGYEGILNEHVVSTARRLKDAGYHTYMVGKWHLGEEEGTRPHDRGFEQTFALLEGAASHYADQMGFVPFQPKVHYSANGQDVPSESIPADFYSTKYYTDKMIEFIDSNVQDGKPFFSYMAYTAPHAPLHAPKENIDKYKDVYTKGWDAIRAERFTRMQNMGIIPDYISLPPSWKDAKTGEEVVTPWDQLSAEDQEFNARLMAVYAGMIDYLDFSIGRMIDHLKTIGEYDNSIMIFQSDNGPHERDRPNVEPYKPTYDKWFADAADPNIDKWPNFAIDNSTENMGLPRSFIMPGYGWAQVSSTPLFGTKSTMAEGGIRVPFMVSFSNHITPGRTTAFASIIDLLPTFLDYANVPEPNTVYNVNDTEKCVFSLDGRSMRAVWEGRRDEVYTDNDNVAFELFGTINKALYNGDWKILRLGDEVWGTGNEQPWKLFNIAMDPRELFDLSAFYPEKLAEMQVAYDQYEKDVGFISDALTDKMPTNATDHPSSDNALILRDAPSRFAVSSKAVRDLVIKSGKDVNYNGTAMSAASFLGLANLPKKQYAIWGQQGLAIFDDGAAMRAAIAANGAKLVSNANVADLQGMSIVYDGVSFAAKDYLPLFRAQPNVQLPLAMVVGTRYGETILYASGAAANAEAMANNKPRQCSDLTGKPELDLTAQAAEAAAAKAAADAAAAASADPASAS